MKTFETVKAIINAEEPSLNPYLDGAIQAIIENERKFHYSSFEQTMNFIMNGGKSVAIEELETLWEKQADVEADIKRWQHLYETLDDELDMFFFKEIIAGVYTVEDKLSEIRNFAANKINALRKEANMLEATTETPSFRSRAFFEEIKQRADLLKEKAA